MATNARLDKVIRWERSKCEVEELKTKQLATSLQDTSVELNSHRSSRASTEQSVVTRPGLDGRILGAFATWRESAKAAEDRLERERVDCEDRLLQQRTRLSAARTRCRLLENLRARRLAVLCYEIDRANEIAATEAFLARWKAGSAERNRR